LVKEANGGPESGTVGGKVPLLALDLLAVDAWPATETADVGGWLWRWSGGGTQRANSVGTLAFAGEGERVIDEAIGEVERRYAAKGMPPRFQVTTISKPADLSERLARRGYRCTERVDALARRLGPSDDDTTFEPALPIEVSAEASPAWMDVYLAVQSESRRIVNRQILARVPHPRAFVSALSEGRVVATGLAVASGPHCIIECMTTAEGARRKGAARSVLAGIEGWALGEGVEWLYLQVVAENAPAQALYRSFGMHRVGGYAYWVREGA
jgi:GNAT superfamily N-acetyltransferase